MTRFFQVNFNITATCLQIPCQKQFFQAFSLGEVHFSVYQFTKKTIVVDIVAYVLRVQNIVFDIITNAIFVQGELFDLDYSSRCWKIDAGEVFVLTNSHSYIAFIKVKSVNYESEIVEFEYRIMDSAE